MNLLNEQVDLPLLNEVQESVLLGLLVDAISDILFRQGFSDHRRELSEIKDLIEKLKG